MIAKADTSTFPETPYEKLDADTQLMMRVSADDTVAFELLVERYQKRLISVLQMLVGDASLAEDLAQDVFLRVFRARKTYQPRAKFSTWLFTIANNVARNAKRSKATRREVQAAAVELRDGADLIQQAAPASTESLPSNRLEQLERAEMVRVAIEGLNERQREALMMCKYDGMSYEDIGQAMDTTSQAIKSLLARARQNLRTVLQPYMRDGVAVTVV